MHAQTFCKRHTHFHTDKPTYWSCLCCTKIITLVIFWFRIIFCFFVQFFTFSRYFFVLRFSVGKYEVNEKPRVWGYKRKGPQIKNSSGRKMFNQKNYKKGSTLVEVNPFQYRGEQILHLRTCLNYSNTSLAAKGALAHRLQRRTACKIQNGHQGAPKWWTGSGKVSTPRFLGVLSNFR